MRTAMEENIYKSGHQIFHRPDKFEDNYSGFNSDWTSTKLTFRFFKHKIDFNLKRKKKSRKNITEDIPGVAAIFVMGKGISKF